MLHFPYFSMKSTPPSQSSIPLLLKNIFIVQFGNLESASLHFMSPLSASLFTRPSQCIPPHPPTPTLHSTLFIHSPHLILWKLPPPPPHTPNSHPLISPLRLPSSHPIPPSTHPAPSYHTFSAAPTPSPVPHPPRLPPSQHLLPVPHCVNLKHLRPPLHPDRSLNPCCSLQPRHYQCNNHFSHRMSITISMPIRGVNKLLPSCG